MNIKINKVHKSIEKIETKEIYRLYLDKVSTCPTSKNKWKDSDVLLIEEEDLKNIYKSAFKLTRHTKIQTFQFKITHQILACKPNLKTWKI